MTAAPCARATLEFSGYLRAANETRFVISDSAAGQVSPWLRLGETFQGFVVKNFSPAEEILTVARDGTVLRLPLKTARVKRANPPDGAGNPGPGGQTRPIPKYVYNAERGAYEVTGYTWVPAELNDARAKLEKARERLKILQDERASALTRKKEFGAAQPTAARAQP